MSQDLHHLNQSEPLNSSIDIWATTESDSDEPYFSPPPIITHTFKSNNDDLPIPLPKGLRVSRLFDDHTLQNGSGLPIKDFILELRSHMLNAYNHYSHSMCAMNTVRLLLHFFFKMFEKSKFTETYEIVYHAHKNGYLGPFLDQGTDADKFHPSSNNLPNFEFDSKCRYIYFVHYEKNTHMGYHDVFVFKKK